MSELFFQSIGAGIGVFVGTLIGLGVRKRSGKSEGLLAQSAFLTAAAAGCLALIVMMGFRAATG